MVVCAVTLEIDLLTLLVPNYVVSYYSLTCLTVYIKYKISNFYDIQTNIQTLFITTYTIIYLNIYDVLQTDRQIEIFFVSTPGIYIPDVDVLVNYKFSSFFPIVISVILWFYNILFFPFSISVH